MSLRFQPLRQPSLCILEQTNRPGPRHTFSWFRAAYQRSSLQFRILSRRSCFLHDQSETNYFNHILGKKYLEPSVSSAIFLLVVSKNLVWFNHRQQHFENVISQRCVSTTDMVSGISKGVRCHPRPQILVALEQFIKFALFKVCDLVLIQPQARPPQTMNAMRPIIAYPPVIANSIFNKVSKWYPAQWQPSKASMLIQLSANALKIGSRVPRASHLYFSPITAVNDSALVARKPAKTKSRPASPIPLDKTAKMVSRSGIIGRDYTTLTGGRDFQQIPSPA